MSNLDLLLRRLEREKRARKEAETLLELKSRDLYEVNEQQHLLTACLADQAHRIQSILDTAPEAILTLELDGQIGSVNPATERIFGYPAEELTGKSIAYLIPSFRANALTEILPTLIAANSSQCHEEIGRRSDGQELPIELTVSALPDDGGYIWLVRDIARRRQMEAQLAHASKMESVGALAAGIAHEINTPIQYVGDNTRFLDDAFQDLDDVFGKIELLLNAYQDGTLRPELVAEVREAAEKADLEYLREEVPKAIAQSLEGAERVVKIVRAMKEFSHPGSEEKTAVDLNRAIESTITVSRNEWKYVSEIELDLDPDLPLVRCLPGDLNQAVLNLVINAAHAIEKRRDDEGKLDQLGTIRVSTRRVGESVELRIADSGTGIPEELLSRIFDPFFTTKPVGKGTGQGLAITYSVIVEKHGGSLDIETKVGEGTTFVIRIPL
ncbi:MAG: PAS domain S-box protein [Planctomycetales bacterium]|nr:PAS domain S-box protein [Planctomycetales bacterium]